MASPIQKSFITCNQELSSNWGREGILSQNPGCEDITSGQNWKHTETAQCMAWGTAHQPGRPAPGHQASPRTPVRIPTPQCLAQLAVRAQHTSSCFPEKIPQFIERYSCGSSSSFLLSARVEALAARWPHGATRLVSPLLSSAPARELTTTGVPPSLSRH